MEIIILATKGTIEIKLKVEWGYKGRGKFTGRFTKHMSIVKNIEKRWRDKQIEKY